MKCTSVHWVDLWVWKQCHNTENHERLLFHSRPEVDIEHLRVESKIRYSLVEGRNFKRNLTGRNLCLYQKILMAVHNTDLRSSVVHFLFTKKGKEKLGKQWVREKYSLTGNVFHVSPLFLLQRACAAWNGLWQNCWLNAWALEAITQLSWRRCCHMTAVFKQFVTNTT